MEDLLRESSHAWVSVRLPNIVDGPEKPVRTSLDGRGIGLSISGASAARFLLHCATSDAFLRATPSVSH
jgi:hypothetical protein